MQPVQIHTSPASAAVVTAKTMVANTNQTLLDANASRRRAFISNGTGQALLVKFGTVASTTSFTVSIGDGGYYEVPEEYSGILDAITTGAGQVMVTEV